MTQQEYIRHIRKQRQKLDELFRRKLPVIVGRMGKDHYQDNFRKSGFVNNGLHKWTPAKRLSAGRKGADANYGTLLSSRNRLFSSVQYTPGDGRVTISNPVPYAWVHNDGFQGTVNIKPHTRKNSLRNLSLKARKDDRIAVKGHTRSVKIPRRQFIGESAELTKKIQERIDTEVEKIITL